MFFWEAFSGLVLRVTLRKPEKGQNIIVHIIQSLDQKVHQLLLDFILYDMR